LKEETGYVANKILHVSLESFSDLGICNACSKIVHLEVDGDDPVNQNPQKHNDEGEYTEVILVPLNQLYQSLVGMCLEKFCTFFVIFCKSFIF
jgi:hypothetical protein